MSPFGKRLFRFAGGSVAVEAREAAAEAIAAYLCARLPGGAEQAGEPAVLLSLSHDAKSGRFQLLRGGQLVAGGGNAGWLAEQLLRNICTGLADQAAGAMVFHAAALCRQGVSVLVPGGSGAGKSTLAFWLARQGWEYLTDELAAVTPGSHALAGLCRPLGLKQSSLPPLASWFDFEAAAAGVMRTPHGVMVSPDLLPEAEGPTGPPVRILFPGYRRKGAFALQPITPARAAMSLMGCLINARNLPGDGLPAVVRLAAAVPAYRLRYGGFDQLGAAGLKLMQS